MEKRFKMNIFISCVKKKGKTKCRAEDMYISDLFKKRLAYAKKLGGEIYILSAKHGVLELDDVIMPYDLTLKNMKAIQKKRWAYRCYLQLKEKNIDFNEEAIFLAGEEYSKYLKLKFKNFYNPLKNMGLGYQLKWLKDEIK